MNWNYDSLPGCSNYEKNNQVPFPYAGANCHPDNDPIVGHPEPSLLGLNLNKNRDVLIEKLDEGQK